MIKDSGLPPVVGYIILLVGFTGFSVYLFYKTEYATYIYIVLALAFTARFADTRRTEFLKLCFGDENLKRIRITENGIIALPFLIFLIGKQQFLFAFILLLLTSILALSNFKTVRNVTIPTPFSKKPFEFTTGFRNSFYGILAAYALAVVAVSVQNFNLGVFSLLFVFAITLSYYSKPEGEFYVWIFRLSPGRFLWGKIKTALWFSFCLVCPILCILGFFFRENVNGLLLFFLGGWTILVCMILSKYSAYPEELSIPGIFLLALCVSFPPLFIVVIPYLFLKSEKRLRPLLYD